MTYGSNIPFLLVVAALMFQNPTRDKSRELPAPTDVHPQLTTELRELELELGKAYLHGFADPKVMDRLVALDFTQRVGDAPERSLPRALWAQPSGNYKVEALQERYHAARQLADNLAVISFMLTQKAHFSGRDRSGDFYVVDLWRKSRGHRQLIAPYSSPIVKRFDRS
jgi:hypothetical protein